LAFNLLLRLKSSAPESPDIALSNLKAFWRTALHREDFFFYVFVSLCLGSLGFLNTWDLPIYLALILMAYAGGKFLAGKSLNNTLILRTLLQGVLLGAGAILLYLFFYLGFSSQAGGILPYIFPPTRLAQYLVMFGPFIVILVVFLLVAARRSGGERFPWGNVLRAWGWIASILIGFYLLILLVGAVLLLSSGSETLSFVQNWFGGLTLSAVLEKVLLARLTNPWLFLLLSAMLALAATAFLGSPVDPQDTRPADQGLLSPAAMFALLLAFLGIGLTFSVEFFYLRDLFGMRMNTIFKFYFQGWILLACASAFAVWWIAHNTPKIPRAVFLSVVTLLAAAGMVYPVMAVRSRTESFSRTPYLDATASFAGAYPQHWAAQPDDWQAIQWILANIRPTSSALPILLEAPGGGYQNYDRISAFTGLPTLLGWTNHEGQWRGSYEEINRRVPDIQTIYTTPSEAEALELLHKWNVSYVILGSAEQQYIQSLCRKPETACSPERALAKFDRFLTRVYSQQSIVIYSVPK
jgi:YYY domain-containing protein